MKILHLINNFDYCDGCARYVFLLMREQKRNKENVIICIGKGDAIELLEKENIPFFIVPQLRHELRSVWNYFMGTVLLFRIVRLIKPDIVHSHHFYTSNLAYIIKIFYGFKQLQTVHQNIKRGILSHLISDITVAVSIAAKNNLIIEHNKANDIKVIQSASSFLELEDITANQIANEIRSKYPEALKIVFVGRLVEEKGILILLECLKRLQNEIPVICVLIGDGELRNEIQSKQQQHSLNLIITGTLQNLKPVLQLADIVVNPSFNEASPMVNYEAGLLSKAVISTNVGGVNEVIINNESGVLIEPHNIDQLYNAIITLYNDKPMSQMYGNNLYHSITKERTVEKMFAEYKKIYQSLLGIKV